MKSVRMNEHPDTRSPTPGSTVSPSLLAAALSGLLGAVTACGTDAAKPPEPAGDAKVTLERKDPNMTEEKFRDACEDAMGTLEAHAHCGGLNSCEGFSYDITIGVYSEHGCAGLNTCTGWSCVLKDAKG
jgi:hypothetical protein